MWSSYYASQLSATPRKFRHKVLMSKLWRFRWQQECSQWKQSAREAFCTDSIQHLGGTFCLHWIHSRWHRKHQSFGFNTLCGNLHGVALNLGSVVLCMNSIHNVRRIGVGEGMGPGSSKWAGVGEFLKHLNKLIRAETMLKRAGVWRKCFIEVEEQGIGSGKFHLPPPPHSLSHPSKHYQQFLTANLSTVFNVFQENPYLTLSLPRGSPLTSKIVWR